MRKNDRDRQDAGSISLRDFLSFYRQKGEEAMDEILEGDEMFENYIRTRQTVRRIVNEEIKRRVR